MVNLPFLRIVTNIEIIMNHDNLLAGAKGLLGDCVRLLTSIKTDYIIVGGWSPLLLNTGEIKHPDRKSVV